MSVTTRDKHSTSSGTTENYHSLHRCGQVEDVYNTGKGYAFVTMADQDGAEKAIAELNGREIDGQAIKVDAAKPPRERGEGGGGGGYRGGRGGGGGFRGGRGGGGGWRDGGNGGYRYEKRPCTELLFHKSTRYHVTGIQLFLS